MVDQPDDRSKAFLLANDVGWSRPELRPLQEVLEVLAPIGEDDVRVVHDQERDVSTLLVGLGDQLGTFLDLVDGDVGERFVDPLTRAVRRHRFLPGLEVHRITVTGIYRGAEVAISVEEETIEEMLDAIEAWATTPPLLERLIAGEREDEVRYVALTWSAAVSAWTLETMWFVGGEEIAGPVFERAT